MPRVLRDEQLDDIEDLARGSFDEDGAEELVDGDDEDEDEDEEDAEEDGE